MGIPLNTPGVIIKNADGTLTNTDPAVIPASVSPLGSLPTIPGPPTATALSALITALYGEGAVVQAGAVPGIPVPTAGANAGTSPPTPLLTAGSSDLRGTITFGTGTSAAAGAEVIVTFGAATLFPSNVQVSVSPSNAAAVALGGAWGVVKTTGSGLCTAFTLQISATPASSQANTIYSFDYIVQA